jgi:hypothetical protein
MAAGAVAHGARGGQLAACILCDGGKGRGSERGRADKSNSHKETPPGDRRLRYEVSDRREASVKAINADD